MKRVNLRVCAVFGMLVTFFACQPVRAQSSDVQRSINAAFTRQFMDLVVRMKATAGAFEKTPTSVSGEQLHSLLGDLKRVTSSPDMMRMPRALITPLMNRFQKEIQAGANIVNSPGLHNSETSALEKAFKSKTNERTLQEFVRYNLFVQAATTTFDTDFWGVANLFYVLLDEKFRDRSNYERALRVIGQYGGGCEVSYGPSRAIPELCLPEIAQKGFEADGAFNLALEWAREKTYYVEKLQIRSPNIRVKAALSHARLEYAHGTRSAARRIIQRVAALEGASKLEPQLRHQLKSWLVRVSQSASPGKSSETTGDQTEITAKTIEKFFLEGNRDFVSMARLVNKINRNAGSTRTRSLFDSVTKQQGAWARIQSECRVRKTTRIREVAVFYPYYGSVMGNGLSNFCRFFFDRNVRRKMRVARPLHNSIYDDHRNFGIEPDFYKEFVRIIEAQDILGYGLAARVSRDLYFNLLNTEYGKGQNPSVREKLKATLATTLLPVYLDRAGDLVSERRYGQAARLLQEFTRTAELRLVAEWKGGSQDIASIGRTLRPMLERAVRYWHIVRTGERRGKPSTTEGAFRAVQLLQLGDVAIAVQAGLRRSSVLSPGAQDIINDYEQAHWRADHLERISAGLTYPTQDGIKRAVREAQGKVARLSPRFVEAFPFYQQFSDVTPRRISSVQGELGKRDALVVLLPAADGTALFVLKRRQAEYYALPVTRAEIKKSVKKIRAGLDPNTVDLDDRTSFDMTEAHGLYRAILAPADRILRDVNHIYVVASGALSALPFHVLLEKPARPGDWENARWLVRKHAITVLPSVVNLTVGHAEKRGSGERDKARFIGFGDPDFSTAGRTTDATRRFANLRSTMFAGHTTKVANLPPIAALPETRDELNAIAQLQGPESAVLHYGQEATEGRVKRMSADGLLAQFGVLYFATHGVLPGEVDGENEAGLILTIPDQPTEEDDGLLSAVEISRLRLNADWVILSACNTAGAALPEGEALSGLAKAFFQAGTRSLLVSHWPVVSDAAVELTVSMFRALEGQQRVTRAEALRLAMVDVLTDSSAGHKLHPSYWAPFVLVGQ